MGTTITRILYVQNAMAEPPKTNARRPSIAAAEGSAADDAPKQRLSAASERRLSVGSLKLRADLEIWLLDAIPKLMGEGSEIDEDTSANFLNSILFDKTEKTSDDIANLVEKTFAAGKSKPGWNAFSHGLVQKIIEVRESFTVARKESKVISVDQEGKEDTKA